MLPPGQGIETKFDKTVTKLVVCSWEEVSEERGQISRM